MISTRSGLSESPAAGRSKACRLSIEAIQKRSPSKLRQDHNSATRPNRGALKVSGMAAPG